jgi:hypothetical protein
MQRLFASLLFCAAVVTASAQTRETQVTDTETMRVNAAKHTTQVDKAVMLTAEQKPQVTEVYMAVERQLAAMNQRFEMAGMSQEDRAAEMRPQWANLDRMVDERLSGILSADQLTKWREVSR